MLLLAQLAGCSVADEPQTAEHDPGPVVIAASSTIDGRGMNVLLVSVDTTRADALGCYGGQEAKTPNIDELASEGALFTTCISSAPLTLPSHASIFTGSYPFVHGARDNGLFSLPDANVTITEIFRDASYATHGEVAAAVLNRGYGIEQGFDTYGDARDVPEEEPEIEAAPTDLDIESDRVIPKNERNAGQISDRAIELLRQKAEGDQPFFMFLHYFDPHWPHAAPEPYDSEYDDGYFAEIAYFDAQLGRVLDELETLGLADDTLVILTSDHGEGRGEHGEFTHSTLVYDSTLHVPLIMRCPGKIPAGIAVEGQVRLVDIAPTLTAFAGLDATPQMQGSSLLPLIDDPTLEERRVCYADTFVPRHNFNYSPLRALRDDEWKYIHAPVAELYQVANDHRELFNVAKSEVDRVDELRQELRDLIASSPPAPGGRGALRSLDEQGVEEIASLGYVSSSWMEDSMSDSNELDDFEPVGINPRDRIESVNLWARGIGSFSYKKLEDAEKLLRQFMKLEPENPGGASYLARALGLLDKHEEAAEWFRRAVELRPDSAIDWRMLGYTTTLLKRYDEGLEAYDAAIELDPTDEMALMNRGKILASQQRYDEAFADYDAVLAIEPGSSAALLQKGMALRLSGRYDEALETLERTVALEPDLNVLRAHEQLALTLQALGRLDEAIELLQYAVANGFDAGLLHERLGDFHLVLGEVETAGRCYERTVELRPERAVARQKLGVSLVARESPDLAIPHLQRALELNPKMPPALFYLGVALEQTGETAEAEHAYRSAIEVAPGFAEVYPAAANLLVQAGDPAAGMALLRQGREAVPTDVNIMNDLAWHLATRPEDDLRDGDEALQLAELASGMTGSERCNEVDTLAAAYAEVGRFDEAVAAAERAIDLARQTGLEDLAGRIAARQELYRAGHPYRAQ